MGNGFDLKALFKRDRHTSDHSRNSEKGEEEDQEEAVCERPKRKSFPDLLRSTSTISLDWGRRREHKDAALEKSVSRAELPQSSIRRRFSVFALSHIFTPDNTSQADPTPPIPRQSRPRPNSQAFLLDQIPNFDIQLPPQPRLSARPKSQVIQPPAQTKEPPILATWGAVPSRKATYQFVAARSKNSIGYNDSLTSRHQQSLDCFSSVHAPKPEPILSQAEIELLFLGAPRFDICQLTTGREPRVIVRRGGIENSAGALGQHDDTLDPPENAELLDITKAIGGPEDSQNVVDTSSGSPMIGQQRGCVELRQFLHMSAIKDGTSKDDSRAPRARETALAESLNLRRFSHADLLARLRRLCENQSNAKEDSVDLSKMHTELTNLLVAPDVITEAYPEGSSTDLESQIASLLVILERKEAWYDFSQAENSLYLGRVLWSDAPQADDEGLNERDTTLLQIVLASELLVRLQKLPKEVRSKRSFSRKILRDLKLARCFLDNVQIDSSPSKRLKDSRSDANLSTTCFSMGTQHPEVAALERSDLVLSPKHKQRQLNALFSFATAVHWPNLEDLRRRFEDGGDMPRDSFIDKASPTSSQYLTPTASFSTTIATEPSTGEHSASLGSSTGASNPTTPRSLQQSFILPSSSISEDYATRVWISGLITSREQESQVLMSLLLAQHSPILALELSSDSSSSVSQTQRHGFIHGTRSFWSTSSVVGRVLAAEQGATESKGWVSSPSLTDFRSPDARKHWIDVSTKKVSRKRLDAEAAKNSAFIRHRPGGVVTAGDEAGIRKKDLRWVEDGFLVLGNEARYEGFEIRSSEPTAMSVSPSASSLPETPTAATTTTTTTTTKQTAYLSFSSKSTSSRGITPKISIPILHDVVFISSTPCFPPLSPPSTPQIIDHDEGRGGAGGGARGGRGGRGEGGRGRCHPLHSSYTFDIIPAATILSCPHNGSSSRDRSSFSSSDANNANNASTDNSNSTILILDSRSEWELELLCRAWCASIGQDAIVAPTGRTCLGCCVREACAVGVGVVIRV